LRKRLQLFETLEKQLKMNMKAAKGDREKQQLAKAVKGS